MDDGSGTRSSFEKETFKGRKTFKAAMPSLARALAGPTPFVTRRAGASDGLINGQKSLQSAPRSRSLARPPAHHDEEDEVEPVPEGVRVLHEVHDVGPALETDDLK